MTFRNFAPVQALVSIGIAASLTACAAGSPEAGRPDATPISSATSTAQAATSSTFDPPPERPEGADGLTLAAAELFVRHYINLMNYAAKTGDTTAMRAASEQGCLGCGKYYASVEKVNEQNGGLIGDYTERVVELTELTRSAKGRLAASTNVTVGSYAARQSPSTKPVAVMASAYTEEMVLSAADGNWQMFEMELTTR